MLRDAQETFEKHGGTTTWNTRTETIPVFALWTALHDGALFVLDVDEF